MAFAHTTSIWSRIISLVRCRLAGLPGHFSAGQRRFMLHTREGMCFLTEWPRIIVGIVTACYGNNITKLLPKLTLCFRAPRLCYWLVLCTCCHWLHVVHVSWKCIAINKCIRLCISSSKAVGSTVEIWHCCTTENSACRMICSYRFGAVTILHEVELHHSFRNNLTYIKEIYTSLQSNKVWANGTWPNVCTDIGCKIKMYRFKVLELFNSTYFMYYLICRNKIKIRNFVIFCVP
jgi:hypothetical protein